MPTFSTKTTIEAPVKVVWEALADIGNIHIWNPGVVHSYPTNDKNGLGATRHCDLGGKNYLNEDVVEWEENKRLTMRIVDTNLPLKRANIHFTLESENSNTVVTVSPVYELRFGFVGKILDSLSVRKTYLNGMNALLRGLKRHAEKLSNSKVRFE